MDFKQFSMMVCSVSYIHPVALSKNSCNARDFVNQKCISLAAAPYCLAFLPCL